MDRIRTCKKCGFILGTRPHSKDEGTDKSFELIRKALDTDAIDQLLVGGRVDPVFKRNIKG